MKNKTISQIQKNCRRIRLTQITKKRENYENPVNNTKWWQLRKTEEKIGLQKLWNKIKNTKK